MPDGTTFRADLCRLIGARPTSSLQRVFSGLSESEVEVHVTDRFLRCEPGPSVERLPTFIWRRIFTLNVDDVLEAVYTRPGNLQSPHSLHFKDAYVEMRTLEQVPIVHLHGWARQPEKGYVFARSEYARVMAEANAWMTVLADIMPVEPFIIAGTTLDEIDLEFYLARRSAISSRKDRGPSFFVEPFPDRQTEAECIRYGLNLYRGTVEQFFAEIDAIAPGRTGPYGLVASETQGLFPTRAPRSVVLSFSNDFDRVPSNPTPGANPAKFCYGNPPEWSDLASNWDVGRSLTARARSIIDAMVSGDLPERVLIVSDNTAVGKTTILRRLAHLIPCRAGIRWRMWRKRLI